jgi:hypothetical protein
VRQGQGGVALGGFHPAVERAALAMAVLAAVGVADR